MHALSPVRFLVEVKRRVRASIVKLLEQALITPWLLKHRWLPPANLVLTADFAAYTFGYDDEELIKEKVRLVRRHTLLSFYRLATLWQQVQYLDRNKIPGALVECGVGRGGAAALMALSHMYGVEIPSRPLHLFDSFLGLPEPRAEVDGALAVREADGRSTGALKPVGIGAVPLDEAQQLLEKEVK
jgi:Macrocin-O-methyltransferase (TylF)